MWIRSQDLYTLIKCERLSIRQCASKKHCVIGDERIVLGEYSTVDKALKVLNEIRNELNDAQYYEIESNGHRMYTLNTGIRVYTMPDDEDVEV